MQTREASLQIDHDDERLFAVVVSVDGGDPVTVAIPDNVDTGRLVARRLNVAFAFLSEGDVPGYNRAVQKLRDQKEGVFFFEDELAESVIPVFVSDQFGGAA